MRYEATFCGARVPLVRRKFRRTLEWIGGRVSTGCPIVIIYTGAKKKALKEQARLSRWGYKATIKRERPCKTVK